MTAQPGDLLADLAGGHDYDGAPCVGEWAVMDRGGPDALALCDRCPDHHFQSCAALLASTPPYGRTGTWAGTNYGTTQLEESS